MTCALKMKPVSFQNMQLLMEGGHQAMALNRVLNTARMMYCDKCGFSTADGALFRRHTNEHNGTKFACSYCPKVLFSEPELKAHLQEHYKYQFTCPHCGQGYIRRLCLLKHIERLHGKLGEKNPVKSAPKKILPSTVASVSILNPQPPLIVLSHGQKNPPPQTMTPTVCVNGRKETQRTLEINLQNAKNLTGAGPSSLNANAHSNMALTVALPDEVTIPAGCKVELVEVKTVNGTKELKLRLVSKQDHNSIVNDARTSAAPSAAAVKATHSNEPINLSAVNRKLPAKTVNTEYPAVVKVNIPQLLTNEVGGVKVAQKRKLAESMNFKWHNYTPKSSKLTLGGEQNVAGAVTQTPHCDGNAQALSPALDYSQLLNLLNSGNHRTPQKTATHGGYIDLVNCNMAKVNTSTVRVQPGQSSQKDAGLNKNRVTAPNLSLKPSLNVPKETLPMVFHQKTTVSVPQCASQRERTQPIILKKPPIPTPVQRQGWSQEPEGFPVISSVFSLSQQPQDDQSSIQPLMMALRGIIMDKSPVTNGVKQVDAGVKSQHCAQQVPSKSKPDVTKETNDHVKVETHEENIPLLSQTSSRVKEENVSADRSGDTSDLRLPKEEAPPSLGPVKDVTTSAPKSDPCLPKYVTVSLMRIDDPAWDRASKVPKLQVSTHKTRPQSLGDCTVLHTMPLKRDQLVKRPGPNQPVVVLNHPKPRAPVQERAALPLDTEEHMPRCQILKMKLSKVIGQKYEVMGCTVRVCP